MWPKAANLEEMYIDGDKTEFYAGEGGLIQCAGLDFSTQDLGGLNFSAAVIAKSTPPPS